MMTVSPQEIRQAIESLALAGRPVCIQSSLRSFGHVDEGAATVVHAFLDAGCTVLVPTFSWSFAIPPPPELRPQRNGWNYRSVGGPSEGTGGVYDAKTEEIDRDMGAIPAFVARQPNRQRGKHPLCSFSALGPLAESLIEDQTVGNVYAPLATLAQVEGQIILMGVGLNSLTLLHLAEQRAGRVLFRRWANDHRGDPGLVDVGGCSEGFENLAGVLEPIRRSTLVGRSKWQVFPARQALSAAIEAIRDDPRITHCKDPKCRRCNDAIAGGPILE